MSFASNLLRAKNLAVRTIESIPEDPWHSKYRLHLMVFGGECRPILWELESCGAHPIYSIRSVRVCRLSSSILHPLRARSRPRTCPNRSRPRQPGQCCAFRRIQTSSRSCAQAPRARADEELASWRVGSPERGERGSGGVKSDLKLVCLEIRWLGLGK